MPEVNRVEGTAEESEALHKLRVMPIDIRPRRIVLSVIEFALFSTATADSMETLFGGLQVRLLAYLISRSLAQGSGIDCGFVPRRNCGIHLGAFDVGFARPLFGQCQSQCQ